VLPADREERSDDGQAKFPGPRGPEAPGNPTAPVGQPLGGQGNLVVPEPAPGTASPHESDDDADGLTNSPSVIFGNQPAPDPKLPPGPPNPAASGDDGLINGPSVIFGNEPAPLQRSIVIIGPTRDDAALESQFRAAYAAHARAERRRAAEAWVDAAVEAAVQSATAGIAAEVEPLRAAAAATAPPPSRGPSLDELRRERAALEQEVRDLQIALENLPGRVQRRARDEFEQRCRADLDARREAKERELREEEEGDGKLRSEIEALTRQLGEIERGQVATELLARSRAIHREAERRLREFGAVGEVWIKAAAPLVMAIRAVERKLRIQHAEDAVTVEELARRSPGAVMRLMKKLPEDIARLCDVLERRAAGGC